MGSIVLFSDQFGDHAAVYLHGDDGDVPEQLSEFFLREETRMTQRISPSGPMYGNRFDDPQYLAARFVAHTIGPGGTGVGVANPAERSDTNYRVLCTQTTRPRVATLDS